MPRALLAPAGWSPGPDLSTTRLVLIRHAHTTSNDGGEQSQLSGWADIPLTPHGYSQVERLRRRFRGGRPFAAIYSSPLRRARETAGALSDIGLGPLYLFPELREIRCGLADGLRLGEVRRRYPEHWDANNRRDDENFRWPGGESYREFRQRALTAIAELAERHRGACVAIVTHAGFITQVIGALEGASPARWDLNRTGNTAITEISWWAGTGVLLQQDDRAHLM